MGCKGSSGINGSVDEIVVDCEYDEYMILWGRGNSGLMGSWRELTAESVNDVAAYRVESDAGKIVVYSSETGGLNLEKKFANLTTSSMSLIFKTLTLFTRLLLSVWSHLVGT